MSLLGIAISPGNIHIMQLKKQRNGYAIKRACHDCLPTGIFHDGKIVAFDVLTQNLQEIVKRERIKGMQAALCLSTEFAFMQRMRLPAGLAMHEVAAEIDLEVQKLSLARREKLIMDFQILPHENKDQIEVMFAVTPEDYVVKYQSSLMAAGLSPVIMDIDVLVMKRALSHQIDKTAMLYVTDSAAYFAIWEEDGNMPYRRWDSDQPIAWLDWFAECAQLCKKFSITQIAVGMGASNINTEELASRYSLQMNVVDPLNTGSAFLLAFGLALRNQLPWLN